MSQLQEVTFDLCLSLAASVILQPPSFGSHLNPFNLFISINFISKKLFAFYSLILYTKKWCYFAPLNMVTYNPTGHLDRGLVLNMVRFCIHHVYLSYVDFSILNVYLSLFLTSCVMHKILLQFLKQGWLNWKSSLSFGKFYDALICF